MTVAERTVIMPHCMLTVLMGLMRGAVINRNSSDRRRMLLLQTSARLSSRPDCEYERQKANDHVPQENHSET